MWQTVESSQTKDRPRPILGRITICSNQTTTNVYGDWSLPDGQIPSTSGEQRSHSSLETNKLTDQGNRTKVNRSQSFSDNGVKINMLLPPDPRRFSFASNESAVSSASSLSDIWSGQTGQNLEGCGGSVWGGDQNDITLGLYAGTAASNTGGGYEGPTRAGTIDLRRRGSDSDCPNFRKLASGITSGYLCDKVVAPNRRDSDIFSWYEERRRSSGYVSDSRRDSNSSNCSQSISPGPPSSSSNSPCPAANIPSVPEHVSPGMEAVPIWLKHLRLHKYTEYIISLTYHELLQLTEEKLQKMNVTKGARRKMLLSIEKLSERHRTLATISSKLETEGCDIKEILLELETIVKSPILIEDEDPQVANARSRRNSAPDSGAEVSDDEENKKLDADVEQQDTVTGAQLVEMIMKTLKKTTSVILLSQHMDTKMVTLLTQILETCLSRTCFQFSHKQLLISWKQKIKALWGPQTSVQNQGIPKEGQKVKFGFPHQSFSKPFLPHSGRLKSKHPPHLGQCDQDALNVPVWYPDNQQQFSNFYLQRNSAPNIHTAGTNSNFAASFKKRHSFQEGVRFFQDKMPIKSSDRGYHAASVEHFWNSQDNFILSPEYDWSHPGGVTANDNPPGQAASMKIFVTCEDETKNEDEDMNDNLENLCLAVTEQALS